MKNREPVGYLPFVLVTLLLVAFWTAVGGGGMVLADWNADRIERGDYDRD